MKKDKSLIQYQMTIYTITYNEETLLPYFIRHYRDNFPGCRIIVYDNYSTDGTRTIALAADCEVILYDSNNQLDDMKYLEIKNHCWQNQKDTWCIVADCDELFDLNAELLLWEAKSGSTVILSQGFDMVNGENNNDIHNITRGVKNDRYSKSYCFNTKRIKEINYSPGCHDCKPIANEDAGPGGLKYSVNKYACYHYRYVSPQFLIKRYNQNRLRMCDNNRRKGMGTQYFQNEPSIRNEFELKQKEADYIREPMAHDGLKVYVTYFQHEQLHRISNAAHLTPVNLSSIPIGELQDNRLSEHRLFLSDIWANEQCAFLGNLTWRWFQKNRHMTSLENIWQLERTPNVVWAAWPDINWYRKSCIDHPGLQKYLDELLFITGMSSEGTGVLANQFICNNKVWCDFIIFFRTCFSYFHHKYGFNYQFYVKDKDASRLAAVFYERVSALYFANRHDLIIKQIPFK